MVDYFRKQNSLDFVEVVDELDDVVVGADAKRKFRRDKNCMGAPKNLFKFL